MKIKSWLLLTIIILFAISLRLINFGSNPVSLYWDEVAIGLDVQSILETGKDINNNHPLQPLFKSYGDYKAPIYILITTFFAKFFGVTEKIIRLPSLLSFAGLCLSLFFLLKLIFPSKKLIPWISLITLSLLPWSYHFSRIGMESHLSLFFLTSSIYFLIKSLKEKKLLLTSLSSLTLSLGIYSYIVLRIIGPILFFLAFLLYKTKSQKFNKKSFLISTVIITVSIFILTSSSFYKESQNYRLSNNNLLTSTTHIESSVQSKLTTTNTIIDRAVFHRYYYKAKEYLSNYLEYFSPQFLFLTGDPNQRHHSGYGGELLLVQGIFLAIGLFSLLKTTPKPKLLILFWLFLSPSIAALVNETPHASRSIYQMIPLVIIISLGINQFFEMKSIRKLTPPLIILVTLINFSLYLYDYHHYYPSRSSLSWIQPYSSVFKHFSQNKTQKQVYLTPDYYQPELYARFYLEDYDNFSFTLPELCPQEAICISKDNWQTITKNPL